MKSKIKRILLKKRGKWMKIAEKKMIFVEFQKKLIVFVDFAKMKAIFELGNYFFDESKWFSVT